MKRFLLSLIAILSFATCSFAASGVIKIGSLWPLTGPGAAWGMPFYNAINWQADQINKAGGIEVAGKRYKIKIISEDSKYSPLVARKAAEKLIYKDGVKFILGPMGSGSLNAIAPLLTQNKVINAVVVNSSNAIGPDKPYCFRPFMGVGEVLVAFLDYFVENKGVKTVQAVDWDTDSARSSGEDFKAACKILGIKCLEQIFYPRDTKDFYPVMTKAIMDNPDMIIVGGGVGLQTLEIKAARELGYKGLLVNNTNTAINVLVKVGDKKFLEGFYNLDFIDSGPLAPPGYKKYKRDWIASGKKWIDAGGPIPANYLPLIIQGIQAAGTVSDTDKIKTAMEKMQYNSPVFGLCKWGGKKRYGINHLALYPVHISQIRNGKGVGVAVVPVEKVRPLLVKK